jgi:hypothetical protein
VDAVGSAGLDAHDVVFGSGDVYLVCYGFQVIRVDTSSILAEMIEFQAFRNGSPVEHVDEAMGAPCLIVPIVVFAAQEAIPERLGPDPVPAPSFLIDDVHLLDRRRFAAGHSGLLSSDDSSIIREAMQAMNTKRMSDYITGLTKGMLRGR